MSRIELNRPLHLVSEYTQALLLALIWRPQPERICMLGFGGGRLSLALHHHLPSATIDNVDIDPLFGRIAERWFGVTFDGRQQLVVDDARRFLERADRPDYAMIVMDAFSDHHDDLDRLATAEFYQAAARRLQTAGVLCVNFLRSDAHFPEKTWTFSRALAGVAVVALKHSVVMFGSARRLDCAGAQARAEALCARLGLDAPLAERAATLVRYRDSELAALHRRLRPVQLIEQP
jgi:spermidine synthase